jgi:hypothetical protein
MAIWNMPESVALEAQTLDKLALGLFATNRLPVGTYHAPTTNFQACIASNHVASLLRPLVNDLVQEELYLEIRKPTNQAAQLVLALRLTDEHCGLWATNLASALEAATGASAVRQNEGRWEVLFTNSLTRAASQPATSRVALERSGDWTLVGVSVETNGLLSDLLGRISTSRTPVLAQHTNAWLEADPTLRQVRQVSSAAPNYWLEASLDLQGIARALGADWTPTNGLPRIALTAIGDGENVRTRGTLKFAQSLSLNLEGWKFPTNVMHDPLVSFTAIRGIRPWLSSMKAWSDLQAGAPPNQVCFWAQGGLPFLTYVAAPLANAPEAAAKVSRRLTRDANPWLATNSLGQFERMGDSGGVVWKGLPVMNPYVESVGTKGDNFLLTGLNDSPVTNRPAPDALFQQVKGYTNLVAYDWEFTGPRIEQWLYMSQFFRFVLKKGQLPPQGRGVTWLEALEPRLANAGTLMTQIGEDQLSVVRKSSLGLTALELHLLVDWLESPEFPRGLNTCIATPVALPRKMQHSAGARIVTNAPPSGQ